MIITIDGPAASGKSTVARLVAQRLGYFYLSTGMLYRALAYILRNYYEYTDSCLIEPCHTDVCDVLAQIAYKTDEKKQVLIFFRDISITSFLKNSAVDRDASLIAPNPFVREQLCHKERTLVGEHSAVIEGRDAGTVVFPYAHCKIFLAASLEIRAQRAYKDSVKEGFSRSLSDITQALQERDTRDIQRSHGALKCAEDGWVLDTSALSVDEVVEQICARCTSSGATL